jgi:hypothetical protein
LIRIWYGRAISPVEKCEPRILAELNEGDIIVCQLSREFLTSDFYVLTELDAAIARKEAGETGLVAYVLKECSGKRIANMIEHLNRFATRLSSIPRSWVPSRCGQCCSGVPGTSMSPLPRR